MADRPIAPPGPLAGFRVLDLGTMIAAPFGAAILADFGADVIKVELAGRGDTLRALAPIQAGRSLFWSVLSRNKRPVSLDMRTARGRGLLLELVKCADAVLENFRPGTLERWGLGYEALRAANPDLVLVRVSGYGQDGPNRDKAGYGTPAAAYGGLTYFTGFPDRPPVVVPIALVDYLAGLFGALSVCMGLLERQRNEQGGQQVDVSLYESMFRLLEAIVPDYGVKGVVRERQGNRTGTTAPVGVYGTADRRWIVLSCSNERIWQRMLAEMGHPEWGDDPRFATNPDRVRHLDELDELIGAWFAAQPAAEALARLDGAGVPVSPVHSMADIFADPHYRARESIVAPVDPELGPIPMPNVGPRFSRTPGAVRHPGLPLGACNAEIYGDLLGLDEQERARLADEGII